MTRSIQRPFEAWYTNCENKRATQPHKHTLRVQQGTRLITVTGPHTHIERRPPPTAACDDISKTTEKTRQLLLSALCTHGQQTGAGVCVCVSVWVSEYKSNRIQLNQQACPLLSAVIQRDPCTQAVFVTKQRIKETGSWEEIDVVQIQCSGPLDGVGAFFNGLKSAVRKQTKGPLHDKHTQIFPSCCRDSFSFQLFALRLWFLLSWEVLHKYQFLSSWNR